MEETNLKARDIPIPTEIRRFVILCKGHCYGPFQSADHAAEWADEAVPIADWTIMPLRKPI